MKLALRILVIVILLAQFIRPERTNPPVDHARTLQAHVEVPANVDALLHAACYDCHSNETDWPWYASVAPASWLVVKDVNEGRRHLNFSTWGDNPARRADHKLEELIEMVGEGEMPLEIYVPLHAEAKLTGEERTAIVEWAKASRAQYAEPGSVEGSVEAEGEHESHD